MRWKYSLALQVGLSQRNSDVRFPKYQRPCPNQFDRLETDIGSHRGTLPLPDGTDHSYYSKQLKMKVTKRGPFSPLIGCSTWKSHWGVEVIGQIPFRVETHKQMHLWDGQLAACSTLPHIWHLISGPTCRLLRKGCFPLKQPILCRKVAILRFIGWAEVQIR